MIRTVKPGELFPDLVHRSDLLPLGSVITVGSAHGPAYEQVAPRTWAEDGGRSPMDAYHLSNPAWLYRTEGESVDLPLESVEAFRWRLRDTALGAAERHGIGNGPVIEMVAAFGAGTPRFTEGGIISSRIDIDRMPDGSVLYTGHPDKPNMMSVCEKKNGRLVLVMGQRDRPAGQPMTIYSLPGDTASAPEVVADDQTLTQIALRAFRVGKTYQRSNSWCSVYDNCMASLGINDKMLSAIGATTHGPGDTVDRDQAARLPEGSILWWLWRSGQGFAVYVRDDSARNLSKTRRLHGWNDDGAHTHGHMTVVQTPDEPMAWRINGGLAAHLPDEVVLRINGVDQRLSADLRRHLVSYYDYAVTRWPL